MAVRRLGIEETQVEMATMAETLVAREVGATEPEIVIVMLVAIMETPVEMATIDHRARKSCYLVSEPSTHWRYSGLSDAAFMAAF